ncbi:glutathione ABC transporter ATP-binding protein [Curtobacterium sp. MMLR14_010]|uniref:ABC transporter ATP-binding protein n=1 Tax=Curtobacterium sp. MMLR14_010 TaxID=1898743 RepID=UPI0008DC5B34|nr:ABC transporter ATP-binding protein [Curtobacterium sp. MMLR14_010]OII38299.1 glutathione ABC transporter ATP-binding protein [Curtobacterium sp. MMLR14_010]
MSTPAAAAAPTATSTPVVKVSGLDVDFAVDDVWTPAVKGLSYEIASGEVVALVGESGSGKSVSSMSILGLLPRNARVKGSVQFTGKELIGLRPAQLREYRGKEIAVIFQEPMTALNPVFTVGSQIVETIRIHYGMSPSEGRARAIELLTLVEMPDPQKAFDSYPHQLSGGQRQRAMIAQSISCDPKLLIADEPTTALDVTVQAEILDLIRDLAGKLGSAVLLITHDMGVVADLADRIIVMQQGVAVETGSVRDVFARPQHEYTRTLLDAVPRLGQAGDEVIDLTETLEAVVEGEPTVHVSDTVTHTDVVSTLGEAVLEFKDVVIEYPGRGRVKAFRAIDGVDLSVHEGEVVGLVGESGSGKSTLGRAAIGLLPITSGTLNVTGVDLSKSTRSLVRKVHQNAGIVFQDPSSSLNPRMTIGQSIGEPLLLGKQMRGRQLEREVQDLLEAVRLPTTYATRFPHELSGGQKQRIGIARALALRPKLLIADEPTSALDVSVQATVLELLKDLQREFRFACLFVTHDLAVIDVLADRIAVLHHGHLVEVGTRDQILRDPQDAYTQRLIAAVPLPDPDVQRERRELRRRILSAGSDD